MNIFNVIKK